MLHNSKLAAMLVLASIIFVFTNTASAHCDSYDGPVIKDAEKALETNNVNLVLKWVSKEQEKEITSLFQKTFELRNGDQEIYNVVEKYFFETLVRLHRETEGAPYTGLKPAGTTKQIIQMTDKAITENNIDGFLQKLNKHIDKVIIEKFNKVEDLYKVKDDSVEKGREYVAAYVDYTHTVEAIHDIIEHGGGSHAGH